MTAPASFVEDLPRVLLLGYGGANNTGADIRTLTIIEDVQAVFGPDVPITVGTVDPVRMRTVVRETATVKVARIPYVFVAETWRQAAKHDVTILVEGSTFKDNWSSALLYLFLWGAWSAKRNGNAAVAYAVDAGKMRPVNRVLARRVADGMDLLVTRTASARDVLRSIGVRNDITVTTDTAFAYEATTSVPEPEQGSVGLAPVDFYRWPVRVRLWGRKRDCYHWPYYYSSNASRRARSAELVQGWVDLATSIVREDGGRCTLIAMEELDQAICEAVRDRLPLDVRERTTLAYAGRASADEIVARLRTLSKLVTSRYHAAVLSMAGHVPQAALYHDERIPSLYAEVGISSHALDHRDGPASEQLQRAYRGLVEDAGAQQLQLRRALQEDLLPRCAENRSVLAAWAERALGKRGRVVA